MSYIDSYRHEIVGQFAGLPVYHPLEDIPGSDDPDMDGDFACSTGQIVIGGGGGEWPGLVVENPTATVLLFLIHGLEGEELEKKIGNQDLEKIEDEYLYKGDILNFCGWGVADTHQFYQLCVSEALANPYRQGEEDISFEDWLARGIGEFVFYAMPDLADPLMSKLKDPYQGLKHIRYNNIGLIPPNMPVYANGGNAWGFVRKKAANNV